MISGFSEEILLSVAKSSKNSEIVREGKKEVYLSGWLLKFQCQCAFCVLILIFHH